MEIFSKFSDEIFILIGSLFTIIAAIIGYFFNRRQESKKHYKKFLFTLLEIWSLSNLVVNFDENDFIKAFKDYLIKKGYLKEEDFSEGYEYLLQQSIRPYFGALLARRRQLGIENYQEFYKNTIFEISKSSPLLAFELNKDHDATKLLNIVDQYLSSFDESSLNDTDTEEDKKNIQKLYSFTKNKIATDIIESMENDIKKVARKSGLFILIRTIKLLKNKKKPLDVLSDKFFDGMIKELESIYTPNMS